MIEVIDICIPDRPVSYNQYAGWLGHQKNTLKRLINGVVRFPDKTKGERASNYMNFKQYKQKWKMLLWTAWIKAQASIDIKDASVPPTFRKRVIIVPHIAYSKGETHMDGANLWGGLKPVIDFMTMPKGLKEEGFGIIEDDSDKYLVEGIPLSYQAKVEVPKAIILTISVVGDDEQTVQDIRRNIDYGEFQDRWMQAGGDYNGILPERIL